MKKFTRCIIFPLLFYFSLFSISAKAGNTTEVLSDVFKKLGFSIEGVGDFSVRKNILREGLKNSFWNIIGEKGGKVVKIEAIKNIKVDSASSYIEERKKVIESLYRSIPSPYPGMISKAIECPDRFKPEVLPLKIEGKDVSIYLLYSTPRFTYGACADDLVKYRAALAFVYNKKRETLYRIELFVPKNNFKKEEILNIFRSVKFQEQPKTGKGKFISIKKKRNNLKKTGRRKTNFKDYNLIIIGFDPLGAKHLASYGYFRTTSPNFDKLSKKSFFFKNAISPSSWTLPVFMSWFTSLYPSQHKILNKYTVSKDKKDTISNLSKLSPSVITLAQILKENGYSTAGFTGDAGINGMFGYNLGFDLYYDKTTFAGFDLVLPMALDWLKKQKNQKFFLFIQAYDVHGRYQHPESFRNKFSDPDYKGKYKGTPDEYWDLRNLSLDSEDIEMSAKDITFWRDWYDGKIYEADRKLGVFLATLDDLEITDRTIIVISSASGNEFYEHKRFDHGYSLYDELICVPLIIKIPGEKGRAVETQVSTMDIMPTVLDLLNVSCGDKIERQMKGQSLIPLMEGSSRALDVFSETDYLLNYFKRCLRTNDGWKFIYSMDTGKRQLYNLNDDPNELNNLLEKENKLAYELEQRLFNWMQSLSVNKR